MLPRTLETEVMDTEVEAVDYDSMDHAAVNCAFVEYFFAVFDAPPEKSGARGGRLRILDVGTGTAQIPVEICRRRNDCQIVAVDLAAEMLKVASRNVAVAGFDDFIQLQRTDAKRLPFDSATFDAVISNSIVHHIPSPRLAIEEMVRVVRPGGLLFVRDLLRPAEVSEVERIVATYAGSENEHQRQMFRDSLHAALTLEEIRELLRSLKISSNCVSQTSDRHWTIVCQR